MYFKKIEMKPWQRHTGGKSYQWYTQSSRGQAFLTHYGPRGWHWVVDFKTVVNSRDRVIRKQGIETSLAKAARQVLKRLLSQRIDSISELMRMLANDQAMHQLAQLGQAKK